MEKSLPVSNKAAGAKWFDSDVAFDSLYPPFIRTLSNYHWTPLGIAYLAGRFLAGDGNARVLDIGCGVGKFCLAAASRMPDAHFYGVEQRATLIEYAEAANRRLKLDNVSFIHGNFTQLDLRNYDHFYFYNSFYENLDAVNKIDDSIDYSPGLYDYYNRYLFRQLQYKPSGTRLCTFCSSEHEIPPDFHVVASELDGLLKFRVKI